jgi:hypothetical protein
MLLVICQLEKGADGLFGSFARLDSHISSVGQTAAKIGDHLQVKFVLCLIANALFSSKVYLIRMIIVPFFRFCNLCL